MLNKCIAAPESAYFRTGIAVWLAELGTYMRTTRLHWPIDCIVRPLIGYLLP